MSIGQTQQFLYIKFEKLICWLKITLVIVGIAILEGCASNAVVYSNKMIQTISPLNNFNVVYIERNLLSESILKSSPKSEPFNFEIARYGYYEIGQSFIEYGSDIFRINGMTANFSKTILSELAAGKLANYDKNSNTLSLEFQQGRVVTQGAVKTVSLLLVANLYRKEGFVRVWNGQFRIHLGNDPAFGVAKTTRVNKEFIESLLSLVLTQMAKEELIVLKGGTVITSIDKKG